MTPLRMHSLGGTSIGDIRLLNFSHATSIRLECGKSISLNFGQGNYWNLVGYDNKTADLVRRARHLSKPSRDGELQSRLSSSLAIGRKLTLGTEVHRACRYRGRLSTGRPGTNGRLEPITGCVDPCSRHAMITSMKARGGIQLSFAYMATARVWCLKSSSRCNDCV